MKKKKITPFYLKPAFLISVTLILVFMGTYISDFIGVFKKDNSDNIQKVNKTQIEIPFTKQGEFQISRGDSLIFKGDVEIADTPHKKAQGLMYRSYMKDNQAMYFIFEEEEPQSFWMKNTRIPLDIIYLNKNNQIVSIAKNAQPYDETSHPSVYPAQFVFEMIGGSADRLNLKMGDKILITRL